MMDNTTMLAPRSEEHQSRLLSSNQRACSQRIALQELWLPAHAAPATEVAGGWCPAVWDGILCWGRAAPGQLLSQRCPAYIAGFHSQANATKFCTEAGEWYSRNDGTPHKTWTNFSLCFNGPEATVIVNFEIVPKNESHIEPYLSTLKIISQMGYSFSLLSLLVAFVIFSCNKRLRCPRNVLHMHLFASFIMRAFMSLLKDSLFVQGIGMTMDLLSRDEGSYFNSEPKMNWLCRMIVSIWQYFIMANYFWILMEGLYLHNLIFLALFSDNSSITSYASLGWGLPAIFVIPWIICRSVLENTLCWTTNDNTMVFLLIRVPTTASIVVSFVLFINIVRVLLLKLKSSVSEETKTYRRWAKSTLVLVPLFGVHYMVFLSLHMVRDNTVEIVWLFCDQLFASFNGFFVALLYCFLNGEVRSELSKRCKNFSFHEILYGWPLLGRGNTSGDIGNSGDRFLGKGRCSQSRGSCYSSTSFMSVSVMPANHCCSLNKKKAENSADHSKQVLRHAPYGKRTSLPAELENVNEVSDSVDKGCIDYV